MRFYLWMPALLVACEAGNPKVTETGNPKVTETGNPQVDARLAVTVMTTDSELVSFEDDSGDLVVNSAWMVFGDLRFVSGEDDCEDPAEADVTVDGPLVVDLIDMESVIDSFKLKSGEYCRIRLPMDRGAQLPPGAPGALDDAAIAIEARRSDGTPVYLTSRSTEDLELKSDDDDPLTVDEDNRHLLVAFDLAVWFDELDLDSAGAEPNGDILIDDDHNQELLDDFEDNIEDAMELFGDDDEDGDLDDDEDDDPLNDR